jgi:hypothetical protein
VEPDEPEPLEDGDDGYDGASSLIVNSQLLSLTFGTALLFL